MDFYRANSLSVKLGAYFPNVTAISEYDHQRAGVPTASFLYDCCQRRGKGKQGERSPTETESEMKERKEEESQCGGGEEERNKGLITVHPMGGTVQKSAYEECVFLD